MDWTTPSSVTTHGYDKTPNFDNLCFYGTTYTKDAWTFYIVTGIRQSLYVTVERIPDDEGERIWGTFAGL